MNDREEWQERLRDICAGGTTRWWSLSEMLTILLKTTINHFCPLLFIWQSAAKTHNCTACSKTTIHTFARIILPHILYLLNFFTPCSIWQSQFLNGIQLFWGQFPFLRLVSISRQKSSVYHTHKATHSNLEEKKFKFL